MQPWHQELILLTTNLLGSRSRMRQWIRYLHTLALPVINLSYRYLLHVSVTDMAIRTRAHVFQFSEFVSADIS